jgi:hypothetical protein
LRSVGQQRACGRHPFDRLGVVYQPTNPPMCRFACRDRSHLRFADSDQHGELPREYRRDTFIAPLVARTQGRRGACQEGRRPGTAPRRHASEQVVHRGVCSRKKAEAAKRCLPWSCCPHAAPRGGLVEFSRRSPCRPGS